MAQGFVQVPLDSIGKKIDTSITTTAGQHRHVMVLGDPLVDAALITAVNAAPAQTAYGLPVRPVPTPESNYHAVATGTNADKANIKAAPAILFAVRVFNNALYPVFIKFHNTAGTPTPGSGVVKTVGVQAGSKGEEVFGPNGMNFTTGLGITMTQGLTDGDTTALAASDCVVDVEYL